MILFIDSKVIGYILAFVGTIVAAYIKRDSDRKDKEIRKLTRDLNESLSLQKDLTQKLENIQDLSGVDLPDFLHEEIRKILGGLRNLDQGWSHQDSRAYESAHTWLKENGDFLINETLDSMERDSNFSQYIKKHPGSLKRLEIGIGDYLSRLLLRLEQEGQERGDLDKPSIFEYSNSIPLSYYRRAFELMEEKVQELLSQNYFQRLVSKISKFFLASRYSEYSTITREDSGLIAFFLRQLIRQFKDLE